MGIYFSLYIVSLTHKRDIFFSLTLLCVIWASQVHHKQAYTSVIPHYPAEDNIMLNFQFCKMSLHASLCVFVHICLAQIYVKPIIVNYADFIHTYIIEIYIFIYIEDIEMFVLEFHPQHKIRRTDGYANILLKWFVLSLPYEQKIIAFDFALLIYWCCLKCCCSWYIYWG